MLVLHQSRIATDLNFQLCPHTGTLLRGYSVSLNKQFILLGRELGSMFSMV